MNYSEFLRQLNREMQDNRGPHQRHIIRFVNRTEYMKCMKQLKRLRRSSLNKLSAIQPIKIIHALSCSLKKGVNLAKHKGIQIIENDPKIKVHALGSATPRTSIPAIPWGVKHIGAPQSWKHSTGENIKIGVIDTGVDFNHPNLRHCLHRGINLVQPQMLPHDDNGHGTHIAGTIAAYAQSLGITGVAPDASIYPIKAFDRNGTAYVSDIVRGIDWCVEQRIHLINMSFGMKSSSPALLDAVKNAYRYGTIIVASSGNDGNRGQADYPACFPQTIAVGATTKKKQIAPFSNRGKQIRIYAPGERILSTWPRNRYAELNGTSMATSHVTGVVALALSIKPNLSSEKIKALIKQTATPIFRKKKATVYEINARRLILAVRKM